MDDNHRFQVDLGGLISVLSEHLYGGPEVFVRELLQNCLDAHTARRILDPTHDGQIRIEVAEEEGVIRFVDDGIGLDRAGVHRFLSTIGQSSKRSATDRPTDFIGQFGIGLLSAFMVSDDVEAVTRVAGDDAETLRWRGNRDGTYTLDALPEVVPVGTTVTLRRKPDAARFYRLETIERLATHYARLLSTPIHVSGDGVEARVNEGLAPWNAAYELASDRDEAYRAFCVELLEFEPLDWVPIRTKAGGMVGVAYVMPWSPNLATPPANRCYLKGMLVNEAVDNLLPRWAFFVRCVFDTTSLRPLASREAFYEEDELLAAREEVGEALRDYLMTLSSSAPRTLSRIVDLHGVSMKGLAIEDDGFYSAIMGLLRFETTLGRLSFDEFRARVRTVFYAPTVDIYRQVATLAAARGIGVVNAGYVNELPLLEKASRVLDDVEAEEIDALSFSDALRPVDVSANDDVARLVSVGSRALGLFGCEVQVRAFDPPEVAAFYARDENAGVVASLEDVRKNANPLFAGMLDELRDGMEEPEHPRLCLNWQCPVVRRTARIDDDDVLTQVVRVLYVQALMLGNYPLGPAEFTTMNQGISALIEAVGSSTRWTQ